MYLLIEHPNGLFDVQMSLFFIGIDIQNLTFVYLDVILTSVSFSRFNLTVVDIISHGYDCLFFLRNFYFAAQRI